MWLGGSGNLMVVELSELPVRIDLLCLIVCKYPVKVERDAKFVVGIIVGRFCREHQPRRTTSARRI
jgi:hypothetical protein